MKLPQGLDRPHRNAILKEVNSRHTHGIFKNALMNPDFRFWERDANAGVFDASGPYNSNPFYIHNGWKCYSDGDDIIDVSYDSTFDGGKFAVQTAKQWGVGQAIESTDADRIGSGPVSISFRAKADIATSLRVALLSWIGSENSITADIISVWDSTPTFASNLTAENTIEDIAITTTERRYEIPNITISTSSIENLMLFIWTPSEETTSQTIYLRNIQLEKNRVCSPYSTLDPTSENFRSTRRIQQLVDSGISALSRTDAANYLLRYTIYYTPKRTSAPTITFKNVAVYEEGSVVNQQASYTKAIENRDSYRANVYCFKAIGGSQPSGFSSGFQIEDEIN